MYMYDQLFMINSSKSSYLLICSCIKAEIEDFSVDDDHYACIMPIR